ncbi:class II aldolase and Adducin N-terminal domain-containing protein [Talaromyces proteolyticus]|uniref:Class II aldolase and Adducin N-terminal domain-containing protein n=1 Tax=Talaromyces proteolyticus TaxID=1131652 RepID=A0AAD4KUM3_9EURO|nr:class II aldolase and Adducin N-terminal domain-containing protein [Talaromyces proteolyticus]KAH8700314.1 class II aldolase and Adducin N-terminal domain-containing protein [Talaromyces proteolyticus]
MESLHKSFISGCHILHYHRILDAYGHLSVRHPTRNDVFLMCRSMAPATVSSRLDIIEYYIEDASPVDPGSPLGYVERFIHSEIYKRYSDVQSIIHSHSPDVVPYSISGVPLQPCVHLAGFLGKKVPNFDILDFYETGDVRDLLIRNRQLGKQLASYFSSNSGGLTEAVVLMRGHGFTVVGGSIEECVFRAIYTSENARIQSSALALSTAHPLATDIKYIHETEIPASTAMTQWSYMRPWKLWVQEVEATSLYTNLA